MTSESRLWLFDVNVLVALGLSTHVHHRVAHEALKAVPHQWATTALTETGFIRCLLNPAVTGGRFTASDVIGVLSEMRNHPQWTFLPDTTSLASTQIDLTSLVGHQQVTDLHLVNLAAAHGAVLATFDAHISASLDPADRHRVHLLTQ